MAIEIRAARLGDAVAIQAIYASVVTGSAISFEEVPPSIEEIQQRIELTLRIYPYLVAVREGKVVGYAYASQHRASGSAGLSSGLCWHFSAQFRQRQVA